MLTSEAQHCSADHVGMMQISSNEPAKIACVFTRSATTAFVREELYAIDILKQTSRLRASVAVSRMKILNGIHTSFAVQTRKFGNLLAVDLRRRISQLFVKGFSQ